MRCKWGDIITLEYGKPVPDKEKKDGQYPVYGTNGQIGTTDLSPLCPYPSVILGRKGAYRGVHFSETPFSVIDTAFYLKNKTDKLDLRWAYYKFLTYDVNRMDSGSAIPSTDRYEIYSISLDLPPLSVQHSTTGVLLNIDDKIAINTKINHNLEQQAQAIFKSWFVDFEPWGGVMPEDWREGTISEIAADIVCGKTPSTKVAEYFGEDIPFITIPDMHGRVYVTTTERSLSITGAASQATKTVPADSVCVSCIATAGLVIITSQVSQTNQQINTIVCKDGFSPFYVYLTMVRMADHIRMLGSSGSATNNLNKGQFSKIEILIPSTGVLKEFSLLITPTFKKIRENQQESEHLAELRDTLLPKLMSGELSVADI